jgi:hypothetical protein
MGAYFLYSAYFILAVQLHLLQLGFSSTDRNTPNSSRHSTRKPWSLGYDI